MCAEEASTRSVALLSATVAIIHLLDRLRLLSEDRFLDLAEQHRCAEGKHNCRGRSNSVCEAPSFPFPPEIALLDWARNASCLLTTAAGAISSPAVHAETTVGCKRITTKIAMIQGNRVIDHVARWGDLFSRCGLF